MAEKKMYYGYHFDVNNMIVETGITHDLAQRRVDLRREYPGTYSFIEQVLDPVPRAAAVRWLSRMARAGWPVRDPEDSET